MSAPARKTGILPFRAAIFDMDGVVTRTADLHAEAWKKLFDGYLREREARGQPGFRPFGIKTESPSAGMATSSPATHRS